MPLPTIPIFTTASRSDLFLRLQERDEVFQVLYIQLCAPILWHNARVKAGDDKCVRVNNTLCDVLFSGGPPTWIIRQTIIDDARKGADSCRASLSVSVAGHTAQRRIF